MHAEPGFRSSVFDKSPSLAATHHTDDPHRVSLMQIKPHSGSRVAVKDIQTRPADARSIGSIKDFAENGFVK